MDGLVLAQPQRAAAGTARPSSGIWPWVCQAESGRTSIRRRGQCVRGRVDGSWAVVTEPAVPAGPRWAMQPDPRSGRLAGDVRALRMARGRVPRYSDGVTARVRHIPVGIGPASRPGQRLTPDRGCEGGRVTSSAERRRAAGS
jgi:hypothetical protein